MSDEQRRTNVLLEQLMSQFRTFGEGLQLLNDKMDAHIEENRREFNLNRQEHQQLMQMIKS
jgi:hypothetical protein